MNYFASKKPLWERPSPITDSQPLVAKGEKQTLRSTDGRIAE